MPQLAPKNKRQYKKTDPLTHIKLRPDTYVGSVKKQKFEAICVADINNEKPSLSMENITYIPALLRIFIEILSNSIDNIYRSQEDDIPMSKIKISLNPEGESSIWNDGTWIPHDKFENSNVAIPQLIFGELLTSDNYDDTIDRYGSGRNGYGAKLTNIFSDIFKIEIGIPNDNDGIQVYRQTWTDGMTICNKPVITQRKNGTPYTLITWKPNFEYFKLNKYSDDILSLYYRHIYETSMIAGCNNISVYLNKKKLPISNLKDYAKLFSDSSEILQIKTDDSTVVLVPDTSYNFIAFTNGVCNIDGGVHVDVWSNAIFKPLLAKFNKKNKPHVNLRDIKQFFRILIKCKLPNPEFSNQSKTFLTSPVPKPKVLTKNINSLMKWNFADKVREIIQGKELLTLKKIEKKKKTFKKISGYDPANLSGTKKSTECVCIFTEGLSAKAYAARGIEKGFEGNKNFPNIKGRDYFGLFPLRGKLLNVRNSNSKSISKNTEIVNIIHALNLKIDVDYTKEKHFNTLNYGMIAFLCDADVDGIHIKGLLMNLFHTLFPTLLERKDSYIISMETPIARVFKGSKTHIFYDEREFKEFISKPENKNLKKKYYKGLGTSSNKEVIETFGEKIIKYKKDDLTDDNMNKVFSSSNADDRKTWLRNYSSECTTEKSSKITEMSYSDFINNDMIRFSIDDCGRSIPNLFDGFKESQRKIIFSIFKKKLNFSGKSLKVAQLAGYVAEHSAYHHGEQCLYDTIIKLANDIVGMNNIPLLYRDGQFGTRLAGGKDAAAGRYIFTKLEKLTRLIFPAIDDNLLPYRHDDGDKIEPIFYMPIIPIILVNGCSAGIGTGWSCNIPTYNPLDIIKCCKIWINSSIDDVPELEPWYRNFKGTVKKISDTRFSTTGVIERQGNKVTITELPIGIWTDKYKEFLEDLLENKLIKSLKNYSTPQKVKFVITEHKNGIKCNIDNLKLTSYVTTTNMVLFTLKGKIKKFKTIKEILDMYCKCRFSIYKKRKKWAIKEVNKELKLAQNKMKYLQMIIDDELIIFKQPEDEIIENLERLHFDKLGKNKNYDYLTHMPNINFSNDKLDKLKKEIEKNQENLKNIQAKTEESTWLEELEILSKEYKSWARKMKY